MMNQIQGMIASIMNDPAPIMERWNQHNCPACIFRGQSRPDTKGRGNHMFRNDGSITYNCFNCHLKTGWSPGRYLSRDMETLLNSYGASDKELAAIKLIAKEMVESGDYEVQDVTASKLYQKIVQRGLRSFTALITLIKSGGMLTIFTHSKNGFASAGNSLSDAP